MAVRVGESPAIRPDALMPVACEKLPGPLSMPGSSNEKAGEPGAQTGAPGPAGEVFAWRQGARRSDRTLASQRERWGGCASAVHVGQRGHPDAPAHVEADFTGAPGR